VTTTTRPKKNGKAVLCRIVLACILYSGCVPVPATVDSKELAESVLTSCGGRRAWNAVRCLTWSRAGRTYYWDRLYQLVRCEDRSVTAIFNLRSRSGSVRDLDRSLETQDLVGEELVTKIGQYCMEFERDRDYFLLPLLLTEPTTEIEYLGESSLPDGRSADRLAVSFALGTTMRTEYEVLVSRDHRMVEYAGQHVRGGAEPEPHRWSKWVTVDGVLVCSDRSDGMPFVNVGTFPQLNRGLWMLGRGESGEPR
jgi:hypothetical protein